MYSSNLSRCCALQADDAHVLCTVTFFTANSQAFLLSRPALLYASILCCPVTLSIHAWSGNRQTHPAEGQAQ